MAALTACLPVFAAEPVVLHAERVHFVDEGQLQQKTSRATGRSLKLQAFGRQFDLILHPNDALSPALEGSSVQLYRGELRGQPDGWVRLSLLNGQWQGLLWDGEMLYAIEPMAHLHAAEDGTAMFRLADTLLPTAVSCSADSQPITATSRKGSQAYEALTAELRRSSMHQAPGASRQLQVSVLADPALIDIHGGDEQSARDAIALRLNNVDGIFSDQLGIEIRPTLIRTSSELPATTAPDELLKNLGQLRQRTPELRASGVTHLFTGRKLDGDVVGNAYVGGVCQAANGAGLTQALGGTAQLWHESLVAAHELGHNLGAVHDGEEACAATPAGRYLMSPDTAGSPEFSACSLDLMRRKASDVSCIGALAAADVTLSRPLGEARALVGRSFNWQVRVRNAGGLATTATAVDIQLPPAVVVESASVVGGSCTSGAGTVSCLLSDIAGESAHSVDLRLRADQIGAYRVEAQVRAGNDSSMDNNTASGMLHITEEIDIGLSLDGPGTATAGQSFILNFTASNASAWTVERARLSIALPRSVTAASLTLPGADCQRTQVDLRCDLPSLAAAAQLSGQIELNASTAGPLRISAELDAPVFDPTPANNSAAVAITLSAADGSTATSTARRGGGGALGAGWLAALAGLLYWHRRRA